MISSIAETLGLGEAVTNLVRVGVLFGIFLLFRKAQKINKYGSIALIRKVAITANYDITSHPKAEKRLTKSVQLVGLLALATCMGFLVFWLVAPQLVTF